MKFLKKYWKDIAALLALMFAIEPQLVAFTQFMLKPNNSLQGTSPLNLVIIALLILILQSVSRLINPLISKPRSKKKYRPKKKLNDNP